MRLWFDHLSQNNPLRILPPQHKMLFVLIGLIISLIAHPPIQIAITVWMSIGVVNYAKIPISIYSKMLGLAIAFWLTSVPALLISIIAVNQQGAIQGDALSGLTIGSYYLYLSYQGFSQITLIFSRTIATVSCVYFLLFTTPLTEILQVLRRLGFPVILTELLLLMYRFIGILLSSASEIWNAQQSRNGYSNHKRWLYSLSLLITQLFQKTMIHYRQLILTTASRGFNGELRVWSSQNYHPSQRYLIEATLGYLVLIILNFQLSR